MPPDSLCRKDHALDQATIIQVIILLILIYLSSFFSSAETCLTTVSKVSLKSLSEEGNKRADTVLTVLDDYGKMLSTILICNNIVNLSASSLFTSLVISTFGANWVSVATAILTVSIILFGEITPKNIAMIRSLEMALSYAPVIHFLMRLLTPVIIVIDTLASGLLKLFHVDKNQHKAITENELRTYVEVGREDGVIEGREKKFIYNVFDFGDSMAEDVMTPRIDMLCVSIDATYKEVLSTFRQEMFTRLPVYDGAPDHIVGIINIKDFILIDDPSTFNLRSMLREAYYTYEYKKTDALLKEMQSNNFNISMVLDEYGMTVGMITLEDLVEEIVGEIRDEYDEEEIEQIHKYDDKTYLVEGSMKLDDINDALGCEFDSENYDSIGGLMIEKLQRLPRNNETVKLDGDITLQCKGIRRNRIVKVLVRFSTPPKTEEDEE